MKMCLILYEIIIDYNYMVFLSTILLSAVLDQFFTTFSGKSYIFCLYSPTAMQTAYQAVKAMKIPI
jgi:hypothetical protein